MNRLTVSENKPGETHFLADVRVIGTLCGLASAVGYTATNIFLRSVSDCNPTWVSCVKAMPTLVLVAPLILWRVQRGRRVLPSAKVLAVLLLTGFIGQLFGNVAFQWSLGVIGIALTVPICLGSLIVGGAVMGRVFLGEPVSIRSACSILILTGAIFVLSLGAGEAYRSVVPEVGEGSVPAARVLAGVVAACISGVAYALLGVVIRYGVTGKTSVSITLASVSIVGIAGLGALSLVQIGWQGIVATDSGDFGFMVLAGICNALAFLALGKALQSSSVVYVNALNATQATMAAVAGVVFFAEPLSASMGLGTALTVAGVLLLDRRRRERSQEELNQTADRAKCPVPTSECAVQSAP